MTNDPSSMYNTDPGKKGTEMFEIGAVQVQCPKCRTGLSLHIGDAGWIICSSCRWHEWLPARMNTGPSAKIESFIRNKAHLLLLLWLLLSSLTITFYYFITKTSSPLPWSLFCVAGFLATLFAVRK